MFFLHHIHKVPFSVREQHGKGLPDAEETCGLVYEQISDI